MVGPNAACEPGGYGTGKEPYEDFPAGPAGELGEGFASALGTRPITEFTANVGGVVTDTNDFNGRITCIVDGLDLV